MKIYKTEQENSGYGQESKAEPKNSTFMAPYGNLPLHFERNDGQAHSEVQYLARGQGYSLFLTGNEAVLTLRKRSKSKDHRRSISPNAEPDLEPEPEEPPAVVRARLVGVQSSIEVVGEELLSGKSNYFIGNNTSKWRTDIPQYKKVTCKEVWHGIDLTYYGNQGQLEYDFIVKPGSDPEVIRLAYDGIEAMSLDDEGNLVLQINEGKLIQHAPIIYQEINGEQRAVSGKFILAETEVGFDIESFDRSRDLIIDPILVFSTCIGGSLTDTGQDLAIDLMGNTYVVGQTESLDFPTENPYQSYQGGIDAFVSKLSPEGNSLIYSTYIGGSSLEGNTTSAKSLFIAVDAAGCAYITGRTDSIDFPTHNPFMTDPGDGYADAFVTKLSQGGDSLVYSTYLGGSTAVGGFVPQDMAYGIDVDGSGCAYVMGYTLSSNFPTVTPYQTDQYGIDVFITKLSASGDSLVYSTYLGGSDHDFGYGGIVVDDSGCAYIAGYTSSTDFPTQNPYQTEPGDGTYDVFVTKLSQTGNSLVYSTYIGGSGGDTASTLDIDIEGCAYVAGSTSSSNYPVQNPFQIFQGNTDVIVTKLSPSGNSLVYSTYLGGSSQESANDIAVDDLGCVYLTGETSSGDFPLLAPLQTIQGGKDGFVTKLSPSGDSLIYSTYLGGSAYYDVGNALQTDAYGNVFVAGGTASADFPTLNPYQGCGSQADAFVSKISTVWWLSITDMAEAEGNSGQYEMIFTVSLDWPALAQVTVDYFSSDDTAISTGVDKDFESVSGSLLFDIGENSKQIAVTVYGDTTIEQDERFYITLSDPTGASLLDSQAVGAIIDDDGPLPLIDVADMALVEGDSGTFLQSLPVYLSQRRGIQVTVDYDLSDGSATQGEDFISSSGTATFDPWTTETAIVLTTYGDTIPEPRETFTVTLSNPINAGIGVGTGIVTINDDDTEPAPTGNLSYDRIHHTATLLPDGRVLAASDCTAEIFDPITTTWSEPENGPPCLLQERHTAALLPDSGVMFGGGFQGSALGDVYIYYPVTGEYGLVPETLHDPRSDHTMTVLLDGRVLFVGGAGNSGCLTSAETYTLSGGAWVHGTAASLPVDQDRSHHTANRLADGRVLVTGGTGSSGVLNSAYLYNPAGDTWTPTGLLNVPRHSHSATLLSDGRVLVAGGEDDLGETLASVEIWNPDSGEWTLTGEMNASRKNQAAVLLGTGEVLVVGGRSTSEHDSYEIYSPGSGTWALAGTLSVPRTDTTTTVLADGRVLVIGGNENYGFTSEMIDSSAGQVMGSISLNETRAGHTATLMPSGNVLLTGGAGLGYLATAEIFNVSDDTVSYTDSMSEARLYHTATLLPDGRVLVAGGYSSSHDPNNTCEMYDEDTPEPDSKWASANPLIYSRAEHTATLLSDGRILFAGGDGLSGPVDRAEIYDPVTGERVETGLHIQPRFFHTATRLPSGEVVIAGGMADESGGQVFRSTEILDPRVKPEATWRAATAMGSRREGHVAVSLRDGKVLVAGGSPDDKTVAIASAEVYDPENDTWTPVAEMTHARYRATATLLWDGKVLVAGGEGIDGWRDDMEIWDPVSDQWFITNWTLSGRGYHTATLLTNGEILFAGGAWDSGVFDDALLFDPLGNQVDRAPIVDLTTNPILFGAPLVITGSQLRGSAEAGSGGTQSSPTDFPVVEMRSVEEDRFVSLAWDPLTTVPPDQLTVSQLPSSLDPGWHFLRVITSGVPSVAKLVRVGCSLSITQQPPVSVTKAVEETAKFVIKVQGARYFQWQKNEIDIPGATSSTYITPPITDGDNGSQYRCLYWTDCTPEPYPYSDTVTLYVTDSVVPIISVTAPNGGESWAYSESDTIRKSHLLVWESDDNFGLSRAKLSYSADEGSTWTCIADSDDIDCSPNGLSADDTSYLWEMPTQEEAANSTPPQTFPSATCRVKVELWDTATPTPNFNEDTSNANFYIIQPTTTAIKTLIFWNSERICNQYDTCDCANWTTDPACTATMRTSRILQELADHPKVMGVIRDLAGATDPVSLNPIASFYTPWDACYDDPGTDCIDAGCLANRQTYANELAGAIRNYILDQANNTYTSTQYVILVGYDAQIPFYRMHDGTSIYPEDEYIAEVSLDPCTTMGSALDDSYYLTDNYYSELSPEESDLASNPYAYLNDFAIGRLVETPEQIEDVIHTFLAQDGQVNALPDVTGENRILVTGFDFLYDTAKQIDLAFDQDGYTPGGDLDELLDNPAPGQEGDEYTPAMLEAALYPTNPDDEVHRIANINTHANHYSFAASQAGSGDESLYCTDATYNPTLCYQGSDMASQSRDLKGTVLYTSGCHSGLPVPSTDGKPLDLPEVMGTKGVVGYIGNTGYGWGLKHGRGLTEDLMEGITDQIVSHGTISIGQALANAKRSYYIKEKRYDVFDEKVLHELSLFGIPNYLVVTEIARGEEGGLPPADGPDRGCWEGICVEKSRETGTGLTLIPPDVTELVLNFTFGSGTYQQVTATDGSGSYYELNGQASGEVGDAIQPHFVYNSYLSGTRAHGILFTGGDYTTEAGFDPVVAVPHTLNYAPVDEGPLPSRSTWTPSVRASFGIAGVIGKRSIGEQGYTNMVVHTGSYDGGTGDESRFSAMQFAIYYSNDSDYLAPTITEPGAGGFHTLNGLTASFSVEAQDASGIYRVVVTYDDGAGSWTSLDLDYNDATLVWEGDLSVRQDIRYYVQVVDKQGNVKILTESGDDVDYGDVPYGSTWTGPRMWTIHLVDNENGDGTGDGLPDVWEDQYACVSSLVNDAAEDPDEDLLTHLEEFTYDTNPCYGDTDGGGENDGSEVRANGTSPKRNPKMGTDDHHLEIRMTESGGYPVVEWPDGTGAAGDCIWESNVGENDTIDGTYWVYRSDDPYFDDTELLVGSLPDGTHCHKDTTAGAGPYYYKVWNYEINTKAPIVGGLVPNHGVVLTQTAVAIYGEYYMTGATVTICGEEATNVFVEDDKKITCMTPAHDTAEACDVTVTNPNGQHGTLSGGFSYQ